jgi:hypothetical protein
MTVAFIGTVVLAGQGGTLGLTAQLGTQHVGELTDRPTDATDAGDVTLTVTAISGHTLSAKITPDFFNVVMRAMQAAFNAADARDHSLDSPSKKIG